MQFDASDRCLGATPTRVPRRLWFVLAALAVAAVFLPVVCNPGFYNHDELELLARTPDLASIAREWLPGVANPASLFWRPTGFPFCRLQLLWTGHVPQLAHAFSLAHHGFNAGLFAWLLHRIGRSPWAAIWLLLLPTAIPGVAWVAAAYDRLSVTGCLAAGLLLTRMTPVAHAGAVVAYLVAVFGKEWSVAMSPALLLFAWRRQRSARNAALVMLLLAVAFAVWRLCVKADDDVYHYRLDAGILKTVGRYLAFAFAAHATDPHRVWGWAWPIGLAGLALLLEAVRSRRLGAIGIGLFLLPLLPVIGVQKPEGQHLYASSLGLALLVHGAVTAVPHANWRWLLVPWLVVHSWLVAWHYHDDGVVMHNLQAAYARLDPAEPATIDVVPSGRDWVVDRFLSYTEKAGSRPPLHRAGPSADRDADRVHLVLCEDGSVRIRP